MKYVTYFVYEVYELLFLTLCFLSLSQWLCHILKTSWNFVNQCHTVEVTFLRHALVRYCGVLYIRFRLHLSIFLSALKLHVIFGFYECLSVHNMIHI